METIKEVLKGVEFNSDDSIIIADVLPNKQLELVVHAAFILNVPFTTGRIKTAKSGTSPHVTSQPTALLHRSLQQTTSKQVTT